MKTNHHPLMGAGKNLALVLLVAVASVATPATAQTDLGPTPGSDLKNVVLSLKVHHPDELGSFINSTVTAGSPQFHQFLTVDQFTARFAPSVQEVQNVVKKLQAAGIQVNDISANRLLAMGRSRISSKNRRTSRLFEELTRQ